MRHPDSSSRFTNVPDGPYGPPLLGALLRMSFETVRRTMLDALHARGFDDLDTPHLAVLQFPGPDGMRPSELAARIGMSKQALNYLLGELERMGYLVREPDPDDLRSRRIRLTGRGHATVPVMRDAVRATERDWASRVGEERLEDLRATLLELNARAG